ncbi:MAG: hypothetical protein HFH55_01750 [Lachnospiraceae bacterium]|nr:hypothetical protein [Lachnospiraceae bacterium]
MKSKILSFSILKESMKKQVWVPALITLGFFLSLPVMGMVYLEILQTGGRTQMEIIEAYSRLIAGTRFPFLAMMMVGSAVLTGVSGFSWLHSRVKTDFYHSLPIRREKIFLNQIVLGILYFVVPYLVNLLLAYVVGIIHGILRGELVRMSLVSFLYQSLFYVLLYLVVVLAMLLTGKVVAGVLGAFVLNFYAPVMSLLLQGLSATFFETYASGDTLLWKILEKGSPVFAYFTCQPDNSFVISGKVWGIGIFAAAVLLALCFFLYRKRPSEAAGRTVAFFRLGKVIQYMIEVVIIVGSGILFCNITVRAPLAWMVFGILLGGVLSHGILEVIYEGDIRRAMAHTWMMGASIVTSMLIIGIFYGDVLGYDDFFPKQDQLQSVRICMGYGMYTGQGYDREQEEAMERLAEDPHVYEVLREIKEGRLVQVKTAEGTEHRRQDGTDPSQIRCVSVEYGLGGGRKAFRSYYVDFEQFCTLLLSLYDNTEYKKIIYPLATLTEEELEKCIDRVEITSGTGDMESPFTGNVQARTEFLKTYRAELMQMDAETLAGEVPVGRLELVADRDFYGDEWYLMGEWMDAEDSGYFIYPSFTRTLAMLEEQGVEMPEGFSLDNVKSVVVYDYRDENENVVDKTIKDREQIAKILPGLVSADCNNGFIPFEDYVDVRVDLAGGGEYGISVQCMVRKGQMPELQ